MSDLLYLPRTEYQRLLGATNDRFEAIAAFADACRLNALSMIMEAGSGHIGSSFSSLDIVCWLHLAEMRGCAASADDDGDVYFSSKGHDVPGLYATLVGLGVLDEGMLHRLRRDGGLPGHPDIMHQPCMITNTGSLGMGISKAKGIVRADRRFGRRRRVFVLLGDGELQEGQIWESLSAAARERMHEIIAIVDHNKIQSDCLVSETADLGDIAAKFAAFDWNVQRCDGHDLRALDNAMKAITGVRPAVIIADTVKGKGVSFMECMSEIDGLPAYLFHSGPPSRDDYARAVSELRGRLDDWLRSRELAPLSPRTRALPTPARSASVPRISFEPIQRRSCVTWSRIRRLSRLMVTWPRIVAYGPRGA